MVVTARRWWSRQDRRDARLAARVLEHQMPAVHDEVRRRTVNALVYGRFDK